MENCQSLMNGQMPSRWTISFNQFSLTDLCSKNCNLQKGADQFKNNATKLERKKRCQPPISCHIDNFKLCSFIRWENWKLTVTIGVVVVVLVIVIIVLAVVFAPSSPVWHVETANISFFCLLYDPGICFTMAYVVLLEFTIKISECHVALLEELMSILHKET